MATHPPNPSNAVSVCEALPSSCYGSECTIDHNLKSKDPLYFKLSFSLVIDHSDRVGLFAPPSRLDTNRDNSQTIHDRRLGAHDVVSEN